MGLDITAYQKVNKSEEWFQKSGIEDFHESHLFKHEHPQMDRSPNMESGSYYVGGESYRFCAGSYSGYNKFREALSVGILGSTPQEVWNNPEKYQGLPFVELIDYSDCEGFFDSEFSKKLFKDFESNEEKFKAYCESLGVNFYFQRYLDFKRGFELASDGGVLVFH